MSQDIHFGCFRRRCIHMAGERLQCIFHQLCNIPRLAEVDECVHGLFVLSQLLQWSCLSTPRERAHGITTREGVKSK